MSPPDKNRRSPASRSCSGAVADQGRGLRGWVCMLALLKQSLSAVDSRAIGLISASAACGTRREHAHPSPSTHSRSDLGLSNFLHQPNVSVWIGEREEGAVVAMFGLGSWELTAAGVDMKEVADVGPAYEELSSRGLDISDDQVQ